MYRVAIRISCGGGETLRDRLAYGDEIAVGVVGSGGGDTEGVGGVKRLIE